MSDHEGRAPEDCDDPFFINGPSSESSSDEESVGNGEQLKVSYNSIRPQVSISNDLISSPYKARKGNRSRRQHRLSDQRVLRLNRSSKQTKPILAIDTKSGFVRNTAYQSFKQGEEPNGHYELSTTLGELLKHVQDPGQPSYGFRDSLNVISRATDTYIPTPETQATRILVWGSQEDAATACMALDHLEKQFRKQRTALRKENWLQTPPDVAQDKDVFDLSEIYPAIANELNLNHEAYFLWPHGVRLDEFIKENDRSTIHDLRVRFLCRFEYNLTEIKYIKILALSKMRLMRVYVRVSNLVKEAITTKSPGYQANFCQVPSFQGSNIQVALVQDPNSKLSFPQIRDDTPSKDQYSYKASRRALRLHSEKQIFNRMKACFKKFQLSQAHPILRFVFGRLGFSQYRKPLHGKAEHSLETFCGMLQHDRTQMHLCGLEIGENKTAHFLEKLSSNILFAEDIAEIHIIQFDFGGTTPDTVLRLETEVRPIKGEAELDLYKQKWYEIDLQKPCMLELNYLDFDSPSLQVRLDMARLHSDDQMKSEMLEFQKSIKLKAFPNGIEPHLKRLVAVTPYQKALKHKSQTLILQYPLRNIDAVLEVQRRDIFKVINGQASMKSHESIYTCQLYFPEWDHRLRQWGSLELGDQSTSQNIIQDLFQGDGFVLPTNFETFMKIVQDVQDSLRIALRDVPTSLAV